MFERLLERVETMARRRAEARRIGLAERLSEALPGGIGAEAVDEGVRLSGRDLLRRLVANPVLRWIVLQCAQDEGRRR